MTEGKSMFSPIDQRLDPVQQASGGRRGARGPAPFDGFSPEEAAARADAVARRLVARRSHQIERFLVPLGAVSAEAEAMREAGRRPFARLAVVIIVGTAVMLFSSWLATLGWPFNPVPHPLANHHKAQ